MNTVKYNQDVIDHAIDHLDNEPDCYGADLHNEIYNTDYFIIGTYEAKKWLENNIGVFDAIEKIREYEQFNFGEVNTDFSDPEKVCNMYVYIEGEEILAESETLRNKWDDNLTEEDCKAIKKDLESL